MSTTLNAVETVTVYIPTPLRSFTNQQAKVQASGSHVGDVLDDLVNQYPKLKQHLYNDAGVLRSFINVYLNDEDIRYLHRVGTQISTGDELSIVPSIAGG